MLEVVRVMGSTYKFLSEGRGVYCEVSLKYGGGASIWGSGIPSMHASELVKGSLLQSQVQDLIEGKYTLAPYLNELPIGAKK